MQNKSERTVRTADLLAQRLCEQGLLSSPGGPCRLYTDVPLWCLGAQTVTALDEPRETDWRPCIDLLVCRGDAALLAVELTPRLYPVTDLAGVARLSTDVPRTLPRGQAEAAAAHMLPLVAEKLLRPEPQDPAAARYLPASGCAAMGWADRAFTERLKQLQMLEYSGSVTCYGRACGLFWEYENDSGRAVRRMAFYNGSKGLLLRLLAPPCLHPRLRPGQVRTAPLYARLERLERGEDSAGAPEDHLQVLLSTPLAVLCGANAEGYSRLRRCLEQALDLLGGRQTSAATYEDALHAVWQLRKRYTASGQRALCAAEKTLLRELIEQLQDPMVHPVPPPAAAAQGAAAPMPLAGRLGSAGENQATGFFGQMPLKSYFAAAAARLQSEYPNWIYRRQFKRGMLLEKNREERYTLYVMADAARISLAEEDENRFLADEETGGSCFAYDLLVEPVFPDPQLHAVYCDVP